MVRPNIDELKASAFALSKILATYKVKLSSQQCLDVLARLTTNVPYEALLARPGSSDPQTSKSHPFGTLSGWLDTAEAFCAVVSKLKTEALYGIVSYRKELPKGLQVDSIAYLRAAGDAVASFTRSAKAFVLAQADVQPKGLLVDLHFTPECSDPESDGVLATLRVQRGEPRRSKHICFEEIDWTRTSEPLLFGAEARIELAARHIPDLSRYKGGEFDGPYHWEAGVSLTYDVCGQPCLKLFAELLQENVMVDGWNAFGPFSVNSSILLTDSRGQEAFDENWSSDDPDAIGRLRKFCVKASQLTDEETCDWPPFFRLTVELDRSNTEADLQRAFTFMCLHAALVQGPSGGWNEIMSEARVRPGE